MRDQELQISNRNTMAALVPQPSPVQDAPNFVPDEYVQNRAQVVKQNGADEVQFAEN